MILGRQRVRCPAAYLHHNKLFETYEQMLSPMYVQTAVLARCHVARSWVRVWTRLFTGTTLQDVFIYFNSLANMPKQSAHASVAKISKNSWNVRWNKWKQSYSERFGMATRSSSVFLAKTINRVNLLILSLKISPCQKIMTDWCYFYSGCYFFKIKNNFVLFLS